jgi:hypothetical protein
MYSRLTFSRALGIPDLTNPGRSETLLEQAQLARPGRTMPFS